MEQATVVKEIWVHLQQQTGVLSRALAPLADAGLNISGINIINARGETLLRLVVEDIPKTLELLRANGWTPVEKDTVVVNLPNEPGAVVRQTTRLEEAGIGVDSVYATTSNANDARLYLAITNSQDIPRAIEALS